MYAPTPTSVIIIITVNFLLYGMSISTSLNHSIDYLDNPFPSNVNLEVRCDTRPEPLTGWSLSPNGEDGSMINTSLPKYAMSQNNILRINGVDASDEGIYRCVHASGNVKRLCIFVYGKLIRHL